MNAPMKSAPTDFIADDKAPRHSWGEPLRLAHKSERECRRCGMIKVTRLERDNCWVEYWHNGEEKVEGRGTPVCSGVKT